MRDTSLPPFLRTRDDGVMLTVRVQPRASSDAVVGLHGDALKVRVRAPPADAAANAALVALLASVVGCPSSAVAIIRGHASRNKVVRIRGVAAAEVARRLAPHPGRD